jgi:hypothetical protein
LVSDLLKIKNGKFALFLADGRRKRCFFQFQDLVDQYKFKIKTMETATVLIERIREKLTVKRSIALLLSVCIFGYLLYRAYQGIEQFQTIGLSLKPQFLLLSAIMYTAGVLLSAKIWSQLLKHLHGTSNYGFDVQVFGISILARKVPGFIWEALSRFALYERQQVKHSVLIMSIVAELMLRSLAGAVAFASAILLERSDTTWYQEYIRLPEHLTRLLPLGILVGILLLLILQSRSHRWLVHYLHSRRQGTETYSATLLRTIAFRKALWWVVGYVGVLIFSGFYLLFFLQAFENLPSVSFWTLFGGFGLAVALGPLSMWLPGDIGVRDGVLYLALRPFLTDPIAAVLVLAIRLWNTLVEIAFGGMCALLLSRTAIHRVSLLSKVSRRNLTGDST